MSANVAAREARNLSPLAPGASVVERSSSNTGAGGSCEGGAR